MTRNAQTYDLRWLENAMQTIWGLVPPNTSIRHARYAACRNLTAVVEDEAGNVIRRSKHETWPEACQWVADQAHQDGFSVEPHPGGWTLGVCPVTPTAAPAAPAPVEFSQVDADELYWARMEAARRKPYGQFTTDADIQAALKLRRRESQVSAVSLKAADLEAIRDAKIEVLYQREWAETSDIVSSYGTRPLLEAAHAEANARIEAVQRKYQAMQDDLTAKCKAKTDALWTTLREWK